MRRSTGSLLVVLGVVWAGGCLDLTPLGKDPAAAVEDSGADGTAADAGGGDAGRDGAPSFGKVRVVVDSQAGPHSVALDKDNVYWTNFEGGTVSAVAKAGSVGGAGVRVMATGQRNPVDVQAGPLQIYFLEQAYNANLQVVGKGGGTPAAAYNFSGTAYRLSMDAQALYVLRERDVVIRILTTGGATTPIPSDSNTYYSVASNGGILFLGADSTIFTAILGGPPSVFATNQRQAVDILVDPTTVYWATLDGLVAKLDADKAGQPPTILADKQAGIRRLAQDTTNLYWTIATIVGAGKVVTVPKAGGPTTELATSLSEPAGIAVDGSGVYFADHGAGTVLAIGK